jgi:hypothetical protein
MDGFYPSGAATPGDAFTPTGALVKAVLVNTCQDMTSISGYPSNQEGWGRHQPRRIAPPRDRAPSKLVVVDVRKRQRPRRRAKVADAGAVPRSRRAPLPLEITLAFHDAPGTRRTRRIPVDQQPRPHGRRASTEQRRLPRQRVHERLVVHRRLARTLKNNVERSRAAGARSSARGSIDDQRDQRPRRRRRATACASPATSRPSAAAEARTRPNYCTPGLTSNFCLAVDQSSSWRRQRLGRVERLHASSAEQRSKAAIARACLFYGAHRPRTRRPGRPNSSQLPVREGPRATHGRA